MSNINIGDSVRFKPGPRSTGTLVAKVTGKEGWFFVTEDATGFQRKIRPGACTLA